MKLYIEELYKISKVDNGVLLENISDALDKLRSLFRRNYFKDNSEYNRIKRDHELHRKSCEKYLIIINKGLNPNMTMSSSTDKKLNINASLGMTSSKTVKEAYYKCKMESDRRYYADLLDLLRRSKVNICKETSDKDKCEKRIEDDIRKTQEDLSTIRFISQYIK